MYNPLNGEQQAERQRKQNRITPLLKDYGAQKDYLFLHFPFSGDRLTAASAIKCGILKRVN